MKTLEKNQTELVDLQKMYDKVVARVVAEGEKLAKYGRIGQKVRIVGRSVSPKGEVVGVIIGIDSNLPFDQETIESWRKNVPATGRSALEGLPSSKVKIFVTEGERKGQTVDHLVSSEWNPVE